MPKNPSRPTLPTRSNKGGALRGQARATAVHALNAARKPREAQPTGIGTGDAAKIFGSTKRRSVGS